MNIRIANENDKELVFALRFEVFVDEQNVPPEIELDKEDEHALHIIAEENGIAIGCGRIVMSDGEAHIGRLAVKRSYRGKGIGASVCRFIIGYCGDIGCRYMWLNSQLQAKGFYEKLGFSPVGDIFTEAGIEHIKMELSTDIHLNGTI